MSQQIKDKFKFKMSQENENKIAYNFIPAPTKLFYVLNKDCYSLLLLLIEKESYWKTKNELKDGYFYMTIAEIEDILNIRQREINLLIETLYINKIIDVVSKGTSGQKRTNKFKVNWKTITDYDKYSLTDIRTLNIFIPKLKRGTSCTYHQPEKALPKCFTKEIESDAKMLYIDESKALPKCFTNIEEKGVKVEVIEEALPNCPRFEPKAMPKAMPKCFTTIDNIDNTEEKKENIKKEITYVSNTDKPRLTNIEGTNVDFFENYLEVEDLDIAELNKLNLTNEEGTRVDSLTNYSSKEKINYSTEEEINLTDSTETYVNSFLNYLEEEKKKPLNYSTEKGLNLTNQEETNVNSLPNLVEEEKPLNYSTEKESSFTDIKTNVNSSLSVKGTSEAITLQPTLVSKVEDISEAKKETPLVALVPPLNKPVTKAEKLAQMKEEESIKVYTSLLHATDNGKSSKSLIIAYNLIAEQRRNVTNNSVLDKHDLAEVYYTFSDVYFDTIISSKRLTNYIYGLEDDDEELDEEKMLNVYYNFVKSKYDKDKVVIAVKAAIAAAKKYA